MPQVTQKAYVKAKHILQGTVDALETHPSWTWTGIIEACYDDTMAVEFVDFSSKIYAQENALFVCAVNYLLLRRANRASRLLSLLEMDSDDAVDREQASSGFASLPDQMQEVFDNFIQAGSKLEINISSSMRKNLTRRWTSIKCGQDVFALIEARKSIASFLRTNFGQNTQYIKDSAITKTLNDTLCLNESKTDMAVLSRAAYESVVGQVTRARR